MSTSSAAADAENTADASRPLRADELRRAKPDRHTFLTLPRTPLHFVLDGLTSASNLGSIFRLADALRVERLWLLGCSVNFKGSRPLADLPLHALMAIVVGIESLGVSSAVLAPCYEVVALPMLGMGNSINVSNALAAAAYWVAAGESGNRTAGSSPRE